MGSRGDTSAKTAATRRGGRARPMFSAFAAMLALLLQVFAVQTHIHGVAASGAYGFVATAHGTTVPHEVAAQPAEPQAACPLCQALANGATPLAPSAPVLDLAFVADVVATPPVVHLAQARPAHPWQSRAPPLSL